MLCSVKGQVGFTESVKWVGVGWGMWCWNVERC